MPNWFPSGVDLVVDVAAATVFLFPLGAAIWLRQAATRCAITGERTKWVGYTRLLSPLSLLIVPAWWSLSIVLYIGFEHPAFTALPLWLLIVLPPCLNMLLARIVLYRADACVFGKGWKGWNTFRLAFWRTVSSTLPLVMVAVAMNDIYYRRLIGFLWMIAAGAAALIGRVELMSAEGLSPRPVKSGELYKRSTALAKKMGIRLTRVCVVPFGRGHLTNAYGGLTQIAITDDYGRWLHGSQLDFVICHELVHVKQRDALKTLASMGIAFATVSTSMLLLPQFLLIGRILLNFGAILLPLMLFYALSRGREYRADRMAVEVTGEPEMAIRALVGLYRSAEVPTQLSRFAELFSTHPRLWSRVDAIAKYGQIPAESVSEVLGQ